MSMEKIKKKMMVFFLNYLNEFSYSNQTYNFFHFFNVMCFTSFSVNPNKQCPMKSNHEKNLDIYVGFLNNENYIRRFFFTTIYSIVNAMIYFLILLKINHGSLHIYSFICIVVSYIMTDFLVNKYKK